MTVTTSTNKTQPLGNGVTTSFPYTFRIFAASDLVVVSTVIATGVDTTLVLGTDYTVTGAGSYNGGNVVFGVAPATGVRITIRRVMSITQQTDLRNNGAYFAETHEDVFDKQTMVDQQLQEQFSRELLQPISDAVPIGQLPTAAVRANKLASYDENGNPTAVFPAPQSATALQALLADPATSAPLLGFVISQDVTLNVPAQYATIAAALAVLAGRVILNTATVTIHVADGTYNLTAGTTANHPDGSRIRIIGNEITPANCVLSVAGSGFDCLSVTNGNTLGYLNGFKFLKTVKALAADNSTAVLANNGATIICGPKIVVDNWYYGIAARNGSYILCDSASVDHSGDVGIWAFVGSSIQCRNAISNNAIDVANNLGYGFQAEYGSSMDCESASATGCRIAGIGSLSNSHVRALSATASTNTGSGLFARDGATIEAHNATAINNTRYGVETLADGHVYYSAITAVGNTINNFCPRAYFDNGALGARIVADDGSIRIDNSGTGGTTFNTSAGCQGGLFSSAGDSHWEWTQAAGRARMVVSSSLANAAGDIEAKGAEVCRMRSNAQIAFQANNSSNLAVNYGQCDGSVAGSPVIFSAQGTDANIDFQFNPKGLGLPRFGTFTGGADTVSNGYITIKDAAGTTRKLMVTA